LIEIDARRIMPGYRRAMPYRWKQGDRKGAWQPTRREAVRNAIGAGVARRDRETGAIVWLEEAIVESGDGRRRPESDRRTPSA
jgi:hypothetical protein